MTAQTLDLPTDIQRHLIRVLRQPPGSRFELFDGEGRIARCRLCQGGQQAEIERMTQLERPSFAIELIQGLAKGEKLDMIIQKGCELGLSKVILSETERSVLKLRTTRESARLARWQKIAREACRQCGQPFLPSIEYSGQLTNALKMAQGELRLMLWEGAGHPLKECLPSWRPQKISLLVGPEGGFSGEEARQAQAAGFEPVRLGPRILRTETAGLAILSILQYLHGDLDTNVSGFPSLENGEDTS